ncbi:unnamed protein product [Auanema sp. JU1783]|nr:unnamed protein product [Auanema sp. JU1783]
MSGGIITTDAVQDALHRAKDRIELAAVDTHTSLKRTLEDDIDQLPAKRANVEGMDGTGLVQMGGAYMQMTGNPNETIVETINIPGNTVGLVIGRGGSEIQNIQAQSQCKVQMSPENEPGSGIRQCTLQGNKMAVERAKQLINDVIARANNRQATGMASYDGGDGRTVTFEMIIPATKCGLIIGKNGDTIKQLQEQAGCKMVMIQESQEVTGQAKPLRITGDVEKVETAKRLVLDLLNSREDNGGVGGVRPQYTSDAPTAKGEVVVPRSSVGMIIGKGGETIKRLAMETGTKIQFKPDDDPSSPDRCAVIMGTRDQIYKATELITELVHKSCNGGAGANTGTNEVFYMHVPANKTGLVIGKGGETIKQINAESGAHCELSRDPPPNAQEKVFIIKGTSYQIHHAQHIIRIKVGDFAPGTPVPPFSGAGGQQTGNGTYGGPAQFGGAQYNQLQQAQPEASNGWGAQPGAQAYYGGAPAAAPAASYPAQAYQQPSAQPYVTPAGQAAAAQPVQAPAPSINPQTGQLDYSAQWAAYYRSMGMHDQASMIENQMKQSQARAATSAQPAAGYGQPQQQFPQTGQFAAAQQQQQPPQF